MAQTRVNGEVTSGNGLGPTTHIVTYSGLEDAANQISLVGTIAGVDTTSGHIAVQCTLPASNIAALANVSAVIATFEDQ